MTEFAHWEPLHKTTVPTAMGENSTFDQKRGDQRWNKTHDKCSALSHYKHNQHDMLNSVATIILRMETMGHMGKSNILPSLKLSIVQEQSKPHPNTSGINI